MKCNGLASCQEYPVHRLVAGRGVVISLNVILFVSFQPSPTYQNLLVCTQSISYNLDEPGDLKICRKRKKETII